MMNNNIKCMSDIYEMDIMEVDRQFGPLLESYYSRLERILDETGDNFDKASDKDKMIIEKMEKVLEVMQERLIEAGLVEDINNNIEDEEEYDMIEDKLVNRFFEILEEGGEYVELFAIRDLMMSEYINGRRYQVEVLQIDDIIEELLERELEAEIEYMAPISNELVEKAYECMWNGDLDRAFNLINLYSQYNYNNPYIYYSLIRNIERITGENYIEICL